jgi:D-alanyl-D-alanine dipeptidase
MPLDSRTRLTSLPTYGWCGVDPANVAGIVAPPAATPIPELFSDTSGAELPLVGDDADGSDEPLINIRHPRIRVLGSYFHSGWPHSLPEALMRQGAALRLVNAVDDLPDGFGLAVWDAWRDPKLQADLHSLAYADGKLAPGFVNPPSPDPATPPPHATGGTVDLTLTWESEPLNLGTRFDEFSSRAHARSLESVPDSDPLALCRDLRRLLRSVMWKAGFVQLDCEWWHFENGTRLWAAVKGKAPRYLATSPYGEDDQ